MLVFIILYYNLIIILMNHDAVNSPGNNLVLNNAC